MLECGTGQLLNDNPNTHFSKIIFLFDSEFFTVSFVVNTAHAVEFLDQSAQSNYWRSQIFGAKNNEIRINFPLEPVRLIVCFLLTLRLIVFVHGS